MKGANATMQDVWELFVCLQLANNFVNDAGRTLGSLVDSSNVTALRKAVS